MLIPSMNERVQNLNQPSKDEWGLVDSLALTPALKDATFQSAIHNLQSTTGLVRAKVSSLLTNDLAMSATDITCINFDKLVTGEDIPEGTLITKQYQSLGVTFSSYDPDGLGLTTLSKFAISSPNVVYAGTELGNIMIATFHDPATSAPAVMGFVSITVDKDTFGNTEELFGLDLGQNNVVAKADVDFSMPGQVVSISTSTPVIHQVVLVTSDYFDDFCFSKVSPAGSSIQGMKWNDLNGNGVKDPGETGLSGWTITLTYGSPPTTNSSCYQRGGKEASSSGKSLEGF
ncbi:hypothetical protein HYR54_15800 [Candidatus Acetothermia bacterium]|nr:hypothetical protein [Candidatus Acetothermia bacterium]